MAGGGRRKLSLVHSRQERDGGVDSGVATQWKSFR